MWVHLLTTGLIDGAGGGAVATPSGGGYSDEKGKKGRKYVVRRGDRLLVFSNEADALNALPEEKQEVPKESPKKASRKQRKETVRESLPVPEDEVRIGQIEALSFRMREEALFRSYLETKQYEALLAMYDRMVRDEEDELFILMAM